MLIPNFKNRDKDITLIVKSESNAFTY